MNTPNMTPEIIEAIHLMYEDNPEIEADCYLCLTEIVSNRDYATQLSNKAFDRLEEMDRCPYCGELMQIHHYKEPHYELDGCPMEDMTEVYCPNCDIGGVDY